MIIVRLNGGLGNQMFEYATGRKLADKLGVELKLDLGKMKQMDGLPLQDIQKVHFYYRLCFMNIRAEFANSNEIRQYQSNTIDTLFSDLKRKIGLGVNKKYTYYKEKQFRFDPNVLEQSDNTLLDGFWQSEKYFIDIQSKIRNDFVFTTKLTKKNMEIANKISELNSVFILIRRGALVNDPKTNATHGYCDIGYYEESIKFISEKVNHPVFFVFSDEPNWAKANLKIDFPCVFISHNNREFYHEDLRLMSMCKHGISANSTWSWWGAWLISYPEKIIIAPKNWFKASVDTTDLIPKNWIRI